MKETVESESLLAWERRHWQRIDDLFTAAEALPESERATYLDQACGSDQRLRARVESLLAAEVATADDIGGLVAEISPFSAARSSISEGDPGALEEPVPDHIGPYEVLHEVGRGGSSSVFLAERADGAFRKKVALKLVRRGLDTQDILRRLYQERQILARLDHPNIARLIDGGSLPDGRPYLVMDYAEGLPIDEDCRRRGLGLRERIELFVEVCRAVHFAHQNLTIHRDIKPSNILVTADGTPKLLDFGIAKVMEPTEGFSWQVTGPGIRFMTPAYASPEQLRGDALSTSTDIYSLGVLLHRLLTGVAPYDLDRLSLQRLEAAIKIPPVRPSQQVNAESMAALGLPASQLRRHRSLLAGDLDTIVAMALRAEPERRLWLRRADGGRSQALPRRPTGPCTSRSVELSGEEICRATHAGAGGGGARDPAAHGRGELLFHPPDPRARSRLPSVRTCGARELEIGPSHGLSSADLRGLESEPLTGRIGNCGSVVGSWSSANRKRAGGGAGSAGQLDGRYRPELHRVGFL